MFLCSNIQNQCRPFSDMTQLMEGVRPDIFSVRPTLTAYSGRYFGGASYSSPPPPPPPPPGSSSYASPEIRYVDDRRRGAGGQDVREFRNKFFDDDDPSAARDNNTATSDQDCAGFYSCSETRSEYRSSAGGASPPAPASHRRLSVDGSPYRPVFNGAAAAPATKFETIQQGREVPRRRTWSPPPPPPAVAQAALFGGAIAHSVHRRFHSNGRLEAAARDDGGENFYEDVESISPPKITPVSGKLTTVSALPAFRTLLNSRLLELEPI